MPRPRLTTTKNIAASVAKAVTDRYDKLPPLPSHQRLTRELGKRNALQNGPDTVYLYCHGAGFEGASWCVGNGADDWPHADHTEHVPGDGKRFDNSAAALRLLSEARSAGFR